MGDRIKIQRRKQIPDSYSYPQLATDISGLRMGTAPGAVNHEISRISLRPQARLTVSQPGDFYEQEADRVAQQVMGMGDRANNNAVQRETSPQEEEENLQLKSLGNTITPLVQREEIPEEEEEEEELIQAKSSLQRFDDGGLAASSNISSKLHSQQGGGSPLADNVRNFMEPRFGVDFSNVKVHTDGEAVQMSRELGAQAFTYGSDIYFGSGKLPGNNELTAHELTHVVQQEGGVGRKCTACEEEKETLQMKFFDKHPQKMIQRASFVGALSETACLFMSDEKIYKFFAYVYFGSRQPNASKHLVHYRFAGGKQYEENVEALFSANPRIRSRIAQLISKQVADGHTQGALIGKGVDDGGDPPIRQSDYDSEDWRNANGNIDEVDWQLMGTYKPNGYNQIQITVVDPYTWHPQEERPTQCLHSAFERLKEQGAADYITQGTGTIMLPPVQQSPDVPLIPIY